MYDMDRLIEFGMSMAIARQMTEAMNSSLRSAQATQREPPQRVYYAVLEGRQAGPFSETELVRLINDKKLSKETYVWHPGLPRWTTAENAPEILRLVALAPPAIGG
jgi:hypothetical protein